MAAVSIQIPAFDDLSGNWLCLDFTHTLILARVFTPHLTPAHLAQHAMEVEPSEG